MATTCFVTIVVANIEAVVGTDARLIVSEIVPELIEWSAEYMASVFGACLLDPRVEVKIGDVSDVIHGATAALDAILLDVDNSPDGLTRAGNDVLYGEAGLRAARRALTPGGVLAVWSAAPDPEFSERLSLCGFETNSTTVRATHSKRGARHTIWLATRIIE